MRWILGFALFAVVLVVYQPTLNNAFIHFDDPAYIVENPNVTSGLSLENTRWAFTTFEQGNWHPITWLWHQMVAQVVGINPRGHHLSSVLLHALNTLILFLLLCRFEDRTPVASESSRLIPWRALMVAALFGLHPINVESVSWAAEHKSLLCMLFSLLAMLAYERYARLRSTGAYLSVVALFVLALMSKPMAVTLPALFLLMDYWPLERVNLEAHDHWKNTWRLVREKLPLFVLSAVSSFVTIVAQRKGDAFKGLEYVRLPLRLENAVLSTALYLRRLVWPSDLAYLYPHRGENLSQLHVAIAATVLLIIIFIVWKMRSHKPLVFGFAFYIVALLPVLGILQVGFQAMADRYAYLPFIGIFIALAWELGAALERLEVKPVLAFAAGAAILCAPSAVTIRTESYWRDSVALFTRAHNVTHPPDLFIETNLAAALLERGRPREAVEHLRIAEKIAPEGFGSHFNVGFVLAAIGEKQQALDELHRALQFPTTEDKKQRAIALIQQLQAQPGTAERNE